MECCCELSLRKSHALPKRFDSGNATHLRKAYPGERLCIRSANAALRISASDMAFRRAQSLVSLLLPDFAVTRVVSVLLMFFRFPSRNNSARLFLTIGHNNKCTPPAARPITMARSSTQSKRCRPLRYDWDPQRRRLHRQSPRRADASWRGAFADPNQTMDRIGAHSACPSPDLPWIQMGRT